MWRSHIPKLNITFPSEILVLSDKRPYRNLAFHNVLAQQGSSYCNRARLNFQAFAFMTRKLRLEKAVVEVKRWVITLVFANWTVLALEETFLSMSRSSRAIHVILRFNSKTQWQMFLLHVYFMAAVFVSLRRTQTRRVLHCDKTLRSFENTWEV